MQHCNRGDLFILPVLLWMQLDMISSAAQFGCNFWASLVFISLTAASSGNAAYFSTYFSSASPKPYKQNMMTKLRKDILCIVSLLLTACHIQLELFDALKIGTLTIRSLKNQNQNCYV